MFDCEQSLEWRDMRAIDLDQVMTIEQNAQLMPWSRGMFEESLDAHQLCRVAESRNKIIAFHIVCPVVDELHVLNLAVAPQYQRRGVGHAVMCDIIELSESKALTKIFLEVRSGNSVAQSLYEKWQFTQIAIRKEYYRTNGIDREDACIYVRQSS